MLAKQIIRCITINPDNTLIADGMLWERTAENKWVKFINTTEKVEVNNPFTIAWLEAMFAADML